ncbi:MAG: MATE family efflux transporter [Deltaproteobacteria bacterium]|jgi:MATE family multidrug resistance protein|nr:MATE family efflux transporter [Deltaproteobacteria bacterium]
MVFFTLGKYKEILRISLPLVLSMGATTFMEFTDRIFLGRYSLDALAASMPAGITSFLFASFFIGAAGYVNVFIAQYTGANDNKKVGASLWQAIYFSIFGGILMALLAFTSVKLFAFIGHAPEIQKLEVIYFRILCYGTGAIILGTTLSCFYSGRGLTKNVMLVHIIGTLFNIPLDYAIINGVWGFPELGIQGAAIATVMSWILITFIFIILIFNKKYNECFSVWNARQFNPKLFTRLMKFGIPGGVQFFLDILAFTFFILIVGRLGKQELTVTNLVMSINALSYMPMFGFSMGVSTLVGQAMGGGKPDSAVIAANSTAHIALFYVFGLILLFVFFPIPLIKMFLPADMAPADLKVIIDMGIILLRFVAAYLFFDSINIIYMGVLKGAGDSMFIMWSMSLTTIFFLFIPVWVGVTNFGMGLYFAWTCITIYLFMLCFIIFTRFYKGKWKTIRILE